MATTPILAPDGNIRDIPNQQVDAAVQGGGKRVTSMIDPTGTSRWIPLEQVPAAIRAGAMPDNAVSATSGLANQQLAKYGIKVGAPPDATALPRQGAPLPVNPADLVQDTLGGIGSIKSKPVVMDFGDPVSRAIVSTGANMPTPTQVAKGAVLSSPGFAQLVAMRQAYQDYKNPPSGSQGLDRAAGQLGIDPQSVRENAANGDYSALAGNALAPILTMTLLKSGGDALASRIPIGAQSLPPEVQARLITRAVNPPADQWNGYIEAVKNEAGNIKAYAQRNNIPLNANTNQAWADAAKGAAQEAKQYYQQNILQPNSNVRVEVGPDFNGSKLAMGESNQRFQTSVSDLENRLDSINDQLRPGYQQAQGGQVLTALDRSGLMAERAMVANKLYSTLAERTGLDPSDVQTLRQRYGRLYQIADQTQQAVNIREKGVQNQAEGSDLPENLQQAIFRGLNRLRGGPAGIADRSLQNAVQQSSINPYDLPATTQVPAVVPQPNPTRTPLYAQVNTQGTINPLTFQPYTDTELAAIQAQQAGNVQARANANASTLQQQLQQQSDRLAMRQQRINERLKDQPPPKDTYRR